MTPDPIAETLAAVFGYPEFRPRQREIIEHLVAGGDAFVLMPTGGGKSLCYQIPALHRQGTAIVVSPLISLMKDQVDALQADGVAAACLNSSLDPGQASAVEERLRRGELDLLYVAPERLMLDRFLGLLSSVRVSLLAIDEAHCISQWGHDFRPEYRKLGRLRQLFPGVPLIALTATADEQTREDVRCRLGIDEAACFISGFDRPNIRYTVLEKRNAPSQLERFLAERPREAGIVYCLSRKRVEDVAERLRDRGVSAEAYHAGLSSERRSRVQDAFLRDELRVVVATVAFGMGIDKPDVRFVVHYDMPKSIESYYQETGRAGRDDRPAEALLLFGLQDVATARFLVETGENPEQVRIELHKLSTMIGFAEATTCRRLVLLAYFGEVRKDPCGNCDVCLDPPRLYDGTVDAQKILSTVIRVREGFGIGHVVDVLRGADTAGIRRWRHDKLSVYGVGAEHTRDTWMSLIRQLIHLGYLRQDLANYSVLQLTQESAGALRGDTSVMLARPAPPARKSKRSQERRVLDAGQVDEALFERLRALRRRLAKDQGVPAYVVFPDSTLMGMAESKPRTPEELLLVSGVGETKLERYGAAFIAEIGEDSGIS